MVFVMRAICFLTFCSAISCSNSQTRQQQRLNTTEIPFETSVEMNRRMVAEEQEDIEQYISDNALDMKRTETGLWYSIADEGSGGAIVKGKVVVLNYTVKLLDGSPLYSSDESGVKEFLVGQGGVESGLEEGILMLKKGSKASFIMPPHLAHGLVGDDDKIPSRAILVYEIEVLDVKDNK
ncbi:MAG: FKBP-type peptidyl-prolyl cis-trans isomerase [Cytophagaceae bacterium]|jgi:FKBP-type peptidyl-prolyl cis-trans isomerase|nr:FKBP-type peptidyl-prolyl cis-trans isomerase [Cytophagaceae bacterium]